MRGTALLLAALIAACSQPADLANPALWETRCAKGGTAWLFGTVHALERPAEWRGAKVDEALAQSDLLMVELADLDNATQAAAVWRKLALTPGQVLLTERVSGASRKPLEQLFTAHNLSEPQFAETETWAAALTVAQAATPQLDSANGIDRAVIAATQGKRMEELEGREAQLAIFDRLPEKEQRDLLEAVIADAARERNESADLAKAWRTGDMQAIAAETERGMLADPELREALFTGRNRIWTERVLAAMKQGLKPFVAVGAAHMAGPDGLPAMLEAKGCRVERIQ